MSETSLSLDLPYIQPAQAQKHVTHNEAIRTLDSLVQLTVLSHTQALPPSDAVEGDHFLVPASGGGAWAGHAHEIAIRDSGAAWRFVPVQTGWIAYVTDIGQQVVFDGSAWGVMQADVSALQNADLVGVGTTADAINKLAVASEASLLTHAGAGHQLKINKADAGDTASLLFQSDFSGRAEMGTAGSDDFEVKTSADGSTWNTAAVFDAATGRARFPSGAQTCQRVDVGGRFLCETDNRWIGFSNTYGVQSQTHSTSSGTGLNPSVNRTNMGAFVPKGAVLERISGFMRGSNAEVTGCDVQVHFQTGPVGAPWLANEDITRVPVAEAPGTDVQPGYQKLDIDLGQMMAPEDGFVLMFLRPVGSLSSSRYIYAALALDYLTPA